MGTWDTFVQSIKRNSWRATDWRKGGTHLKAMHQLMLNQPLPPVPGCDAGEERHSPSLSGYFHCWNSASCTWKVSGTRLGIPYVNYLPGA